MIRLTPEDLKQNDGYKLLAEIDHQEVKPFILSQVRQGSGLIRWFSLYQGLMILLFVFLVVKAIIAYLHGLDAPLADLGLSILFSFTLLVIVHETLHALAYLLCGVKKIRAGAIWRKFIFYVMADLQVIGARTFFIVAFAPLVVIKIICLILGILFWNTDLVYFFFGVMCIHSLFCAGDIAMVAFYKLHPNKTILNFDDRKLGKTFFYYREKQLKA